MFRRNSASTIGIIGNPDEEIIKFLEERTGKRVRKVEKNGKTKIVIGRGIFKKTINIDHP